MSSALPSLHNNYCEPFDPQWISVTHQSNICMCRCSIETLELNFISLIKSYYSQKCIHDCIKAFIVHINS